MAGPTTWGYQVLGFGSGKKPSSVVPTTKLQVTIAQFDEENDCACSLSSTVEIWEDSSDEGGMGLEPSVGQWLHDGFQCGQVTAVNATGSVDSYTASSNSDCAECNDELLACTSGGPGGGGPSGPGFCLLPYMLVKLIDGSLAKVIDLNMGDLIEGPNGFSEVVELLKDHKREGYYIIEDELHITNDHPILVGSEMVKAEDYDGNKRYVKEATNTVYVGTLQPLFNVYCGESVYSVDGQYAAKSTSF